jgi:lysophospholipase-3
VSPQWKKKYIKAFIPVGAPFGGALKALGAILFGSPLETVVSHVSKLSTVGKPLASVIKLPILKNVIPTLLRTLFRTFPSIAFLIPRADIFGNKELVKTSWKSYTAHNYKRLYKAIVDPIGWEMYQPTLAINAGYRNPDVPTYCIYGTGKKTAEQYVYKSYLPWGLPHTIKYGNGDGTVNLESLEVCHRWTKNVDIFEGLGHTSILTSCRSLKRMFAIANA